MPLLLCIRLMHNEYFPGVQQPLVDILKNIGTLGMTYKPQLNADVSTYLKRATIILM